MLGSAGELMVSCDGVWLYRTVGTVLINILNIHTRSKNMSEVAAVTAVVENYINAGVTGDSAQMAKSFHPDATIHGVSTEGKSEGGPIQILFDAIEGQPSPGLTGVVGPVEVNSTTATATAVLNDWGGVDYTDQFTLLKVDGNWQILSKVYHDRANG